MDDDKNGCVAYLIYGVLLFGGMILVSIFKISSHTVLVVIGSFSVAIIVYCIGHFMGQEQVKKKRSAKYFDKYKPKKDS